MTKFENEMLEQLLFMKEQELKELAEDENLKMKREAILDTEKACNRLSGELFFIEIHKYTGF